jgi:hypothetical protein
MARNHGAQGLWTSFDVSDTKQPLSLHRVGTWSQNSAKRVSLNETFIMSAASTVALMILMPFPDPPLHATPPPESSSDSDPDNEKPLPYFEFGLVDVELPKEISDSGQ